MEWLCGNVSKLAEEESERESEREREREREREAAFITIHILKRPIQKFDLAHWLVHRAGN